LYRSGSIYRTRILVKGKGIRKSRHVIGMQKGCSMRKRRVICVLMTAVTLMVILSACRSKSETTDVSADNDDLFTIRVMTQTGFNELNVADELGYFKEEGIKISYIGTLGKGVTEYQLIEQGQLDAFTGGHPPNVAQARLAGVKVKAVAPGMVDNEDFPHVRYLVQDSSPLQSLEDITDEKISISGIGACNDGYIKYYLQSKGLPYDKIEWVTLSTGGQQEQSLVQGQIAVTTSHPPYAGKSLAAGGVREIGTSWDIFHSPGAGLSVRGFSEKFIEEHPEIVQGFVNAMYKARIWINTHQEEAIEINAKYLKLEPKDLSVFWYDESKNITPDYIEQWFKIAEAIGLWKEGDIMPEEVYTNDFIPK